MYSTYVASRLAHGRLDHVSIAWRPATPDGLGGGCMPPPPRSTATATGTLIEQVIEPCTMAKVGHCLDLELHKL